MATYYVATTGNNANAGTSAAPFLTIPYAMEFASPGDTVNVKAGTYGAVNTRIELFSPASGASGAPITLQRDPAATTRPVLKGQLYISANYLTVKGFEMPGPGGVFNGSKLAGIFIFGTGVTITGCEIYNYDAKAGIYVNSPGWVDILGNYIHDNGDFGNAASASQDHNIYWDVGSGLIANNILVNAWSWSIQFYQNGNDVKVVNNVIANNIYQAGIIISINTANVEVFNNIFVGNRQNIYAYQLSGSGNSVHDNLMWGSTVASTWQDGGNGATIANYNNPSANPLLDAAWKPTAGSPAIDTGLTTSLTTTDYIGTTRPQGSAYDKGAYEIIGSGDTTPTDRIINGKFETDIGGWTNDSYVTPTTLARSTGWASSGTASLRFTVTDTNATPRADGFRSPSGAGGVAAWTVAPGEVLPLSAKLNILTQPAVGTKFRVYWYDTAGVYLSITTGAVAATGTGMKTLQESFTVPAGVSRASFGVFSAVGGSETLYDLYVDEVTTLPLAAPPAPPATPGSLLSGVTAYTQLVNGNLATAVPVMGNFNNAKTAIDAVVTRLNTRPVVTGSKGGNAALTSLVAALVNLGLISDNTT